MIDCFFPQAMRNQFRIRGKAMTSVTVAKKNKNDYGSFLLSNFSGTNWTSYFGKSAFMRCSLLPNFSGKDNQV